MFEITSFNIICFFSANSVAFVIGHIFVQKFCGSTRKSASPVVVFINYSAVYLTATMLGYGAIFLSAADINLSTKTSSFLVYFFMSIGLVYAYFHVFNMSQTATRIGIMVSILRGSDERLLEQKDTDLSHAMINARLDRLIKMGQIAINSRSELKVISTKFLWIGRLLNLIGFVMLGRNRYED